MAVAVAPETQCPVELWECYETWECWRAVREGGGVFEIVECGGDFCAYCWGARRIYYEGFYGWAMLPCLECLGTGVEPRRAMVRLIERRAVAR